MASQITKTQTAVHRVLFTPELLEAVLLEVPYHDLLASAQRVCAFFFETVNSSITLQQALFFVPRAAPYVPERNPLLLTQSWSDYMEHRIPRRIEPGDGPSAYYPWYNNLDFTAIDWHAYRKIRDPYEREEASWRKMFISQPPVTILEADAKIGFWGLRCNTGLTMGMLERKWRVDWSGYIIGRPRLSVVVNTSPYLKKTWL
jgi:hypothetical protein